MQEHRRESGAAGRRYIALERRMTEYAFQIGTGLIMHDRDLRGASSLQLTYRRPPMERRFGYYIVLGLVIGAVLGVGWGVTSGNPALGSLLGALAGLFIGWFAAAADLKMRSEKKDRGNHAP